MSLSCPERISWRLAARGFNQVQHVCVEFNHEEKIGVFERIMEFIEEFVENQASLRKVTLDFYNWRDGKKDMIQKIQCDNKFMKWSKVIKFDFIDIFK